MTDAWAADPFGRRLSVEDLDHAALVALNASIGTLRRRLEAVHARVASEIARQSRPEFGADGLAKKNGYPSPAVLIAATTGTTLGDASRLVAVGEATAPRRTFTGMDAPARHPHVAEALAAGRLGMPAASAIIAMLDRVALRAGVDDREHAEQVLAEQAVGLPLDQVGKLVARAEAWLDPDGLEPKEHELRRERSLHLFERDGMLHLNAKLDPESAAPVKAAIEAVVTAGCKERPACRVMGLARGTRPAGLACRAMLTRLGPRSPSGRPTRSCSSRRTCSAAVPTIVPSRARRSSCGCRSPISSPAPDRR